LATNSDEFVNSNDFSPTASSNGYDGDDFDSASNDGSDFYDSKIIDNHADIDIPNLTDYNSDNDDESYSDFDNSNIIIHKSKDTSSHDDNKNIETNQSINDDNDDEMDMDTSSTYISEPEYEEEEEEDIDDEEEEDLDKKKICCSYLKENKEYWNLPFFLSFRTFFRNQYSDAKEYEPKRIIHLLRWTFTVAHKGEKQLKPKCLAKWTYMLFTKYIQLVIQYTNSYMRDEKHLAWSTIRLFLSTTLHTYFNFFTSIRENCQTKYVISIAELYQYKNVISVIRKQCNRNLKRTSMQKRHKGRMISDLEQPPGENPLVEMKKILQAKYNQYEKLNFVDNVTYNKYIHFLAAAFYIGPQGSCNIDIYLYM
jgi:hypothetical protein